NFDIPAESAIASYNWNDVADGTGNVTFYLLQTNTGYLLHQQPLPSSGANYEKVYSYSGLETPGEALWPEEIQLLYKQLKS
ncbi:MAG: hypothetical protein PHC95_13530, partial [Parabacteroides sp.]|nr:hypothetical protein [Parabacteroides sp.]